jgi:hypothetical protein
LVRLQEIRMDYGRGATCNLFGMRYHLDLYVPKWIWFIWTYSEENLVNFAGFKENLACLQEIRMDWGLRSDL